MSFDLDIGWSNGRSEIALCCRTGPGLIALIGPSGAGKTSILNMIAGIIRPDRGHIRVDGETLFDSAAGMDRPVALRRSGYIFQDRRLFPHMRVRGNLTYAHRPSEVVDFDGVVTMLGLKPLLDRWPSTLSGGEAQRVAIGRALLSAPRFLLMDEPLASIDAARKEEIMQAIETILSAVNLPILYVTHDEREAARLASEVLTIG
ncbi:ATP-binding cassette domain-containing protein [Sphingobium sp.]|uniref:ATP-binding cassette domain-containing protein n=1 Tax=Sphingobium sp. TaxID=1912891 RepID=UPI003BB71997